MLVMKRLEEGAGKICKALVPIKHEYYLGSGKAVAICTLSSIDLLEMISRLYLMNKVLIAGRLLSENKGIDAMIAFTIKHPELSRMLICGKEVKGHRAGQALLALASNGMDLSGRIIGAASPNPIVTLCAEEVDTFRRQVQIIDLMGSDLSHISRMVDYYSKF
jgi:tetrahydromethanopterin S-methyltransferase subunit A